MKVSQSKPLKFRKNHYHLGIVQVCLALLLQGCNFIQGVLNFGDNQENQTSPSIHGSEKMDMSIIETSKHSEDFLSSNKQFCGDILPQNKNNYPIQLFPVLINIKELNTKKLKLLECSFILKQNRREDIKVIVALFLTQERAKNFISSNIFDQATVGNPVTIDNPPDVEVAKLGQLNKSLLPWLAYISSEQEKIFKIVLPTYLPPNFSVARVKIRSGVSNRAYHLDYQGTNGYCFSMGGLGFSSGGGGNFSGHQEIDIESDIFGNQKFIYSEGHDRRSFFAPALNVMIINESSSIPFELRTAGVYEFISPGWFQPECKTLAVPELVKIFKSMKYLN